MRLREDDNLVELKVVEKLDQLLGLGVLVKLDEVLLEAVQGELGVAADIQLEWVLHEHLADALGLVRQGC